MYQLSFISSESVITEKSFSSNDDESTTQYAEDEETPALYPIESKIAPIESKIESDSCSTLLHGL